jgi:hypothetical protein
MMVPNVAKAQAPWPNELNRPALDWLQNLTLTQWVSNVFHPVQWPGQNPDFIDRVRRFF